MTKKIGRNRRAAILVLTLWIVVVLGLISASMLSEIYLGLKLAKYQRDDFEAMALARAGVAKAVADLRNDLIMDRDVREEPVDALSDIWARTDEEKTGKDNEGVPMGRGAFHVWIDDEASKLNPSMVNENVLKAALSELGLEKPEMEKVAAAIIDYVDPDNDARPPGVGKEDEYYSSVVAKEAGVRWDRNQPPVFHCKNDKLSSLEELLSVPGVTPKLLYGVDLEDEVPESPVERLKARAEDARTGKRPDKKIGLRDIFSVQAPGPINVNTADRLVLRILFRSVLDNPQVSAALADKVLAARGDGKRAAGGNQKVFRSARDLTPAMGQAGVAERLMQSPGLIVRSDWYHIWALGEVKGTARLISASVTRSIDVCAPDALNPLIDRGIINPRLVEAFRRRHQFNREPIEQPTVRVVQWQEL